MAVWLAEHAGSVGYTHFHAGDALPDPAEVDLLIGDPSKAHQKLGWRHETPVRDLAREMVQADLETMKSAPIGRGS